ncbi:Uncharacterised protein [Slackia heliotrinireducens]|uniref:Uncharacterized protein n=1 Tax=Slackia heliotrinireducens (strain ATCC 29202 / DSM 20476 / NCTC 11029 / RHS 1) TaxID=471855 RepID=C7N6R4_SLAHD|nr:hypothetical protein Shel_15800 [Slackia heliotrinireducens DSM 20476]VEH01109.1 Uncharacterised protein [Slackia heliotrinireducens]
MRPWDAAWLAVVSALIVAAALAVLAINTVSM